MKPSRHVHPSGRRKRRRAACQSTQRLSGVLSRVLQSPWWNSQRRSPEAPKRALRTAAPRPPCRATRPYPQLCGMACAPAARRHAAALPTASGPCACHTQALAGCAARRKDGAPACARKAPCGSHTRSCKECGRGRWLGRRPEAGTRVASRSSLGGYDQRMV